MACVAILIVAMLAVYANSLTAPFIFDDEFLSREVAQKNFYQLVHPGISGFRPLYKLSIALNYHLNGTHVWSYHLVNILIHAINTIWVFIIVEKTLLLPCFEGRFKGSARWLGLLSALFWGLHPLNTQAVTYISQRCEIMMAMFYLLTLLCLIKVHEHRDSKAWQAAAIMCLFCGFISKEAMISAPLILVIYDRLFLKKTFKAVFTDHRVFYVGMGAVLLMPFLYLTMKGQLSDYLSYLTGRHNISTWHYLLTQPAVVLHYLKLSFLPTGLCFDYLWPIEPHLVHALLPISFWLLLAALLAYLLVKRTFIGFPLLFFAVNILPRSSIIVSTNAAVEYRMYLPLIGVIVFTVLCIYSLLKTHWIQPALNGKLLLMVPTVAIIALGVLTFRRNQVYHSKYTLWRDTVSKAPDNYRALNYLGIELSRKRQMAGAQTCFEKALKLKPGNIISLTNLGNIKAETGDLDAAIMLYNRALRWEILRRKDIYKYYLKNTHQNLAKAYFRKHLFQKSLMHFERALEYAPEDAALLYDLGYFHLQMRDSQKAERCFKKALQADPEFEPAREYLKALGK